MSKTVLITGATGFLGRHVLAALSATPGYEVVCCVRRAGASSGECETVECDIGVPSQILALAGRRRAEAIVHLASDVDFVSADDAQLFAPNVLATGCFAWLAREWNAHLLFASSVAVHGVRAERMAADAPIHPDTPYGRSKWLGEELIASSGISHAIVRIAGIFGANGPRHLGLNRAIDDALGGTPPTLVGAGEARRNYVYAKDAAAAVVFALGQRLEGVHYLAGTEVSSVAQMLAAVCEKLLPGTSPLVKEGPRAADQIVESSSSLPRTRSFRDALDDIVQARRQCA